MSVAAAHARAYRLLGGTVDDPAFHASGWDVDGDTVSLRYRIDGLGELVETVAFPGRDLRAAADDPATAGALTVLHLAAASSYYKAVLPRRVELGAVPRSAITMVSALLTHGLAEYAVHNELDVAELLAYPQVHGDEVAPLPAAPRPAGAVVPVGGGKDSAVTAMLAVREGWDTVTFAVNPRPSMQRTADAVGLPLVTARRKLDPRLLAWNEAGALNGHVPITAIVASIACVAATLDGRGDVLLSNEASADEPTRTVGGVQVNHQYSKSSAFEALHLRATQDATGGATRALSVLRPLPELLVAAAFARLGAPLAAVNSCNRAYSMTQERREWCGTCPKCLFVQTMLAPFTTPEAFRRDTGFDALADHDRVEDLRDLTDPVRKPFECVGTVEEVQLAFDLLADDPAWSDHLAVTAIGRPGRDARSRLDAMIAATDLGNLREPYAGALRSLAAELRPEAAT